MKTTRHRLDRFISQHSKYSKSDVRLLLAQKRIVLDGKAAHSAQQIVGQFTHVQLDGKTLQQQTPVYLMLNKPKGIVSATKDAKHQTVIDAISHGQKHQLHIVGRLDKNTTGLVLLTNDGAWSRKISLPKTKLYKTYEVQTAKPITQDYIEAFKNGIYFDYEGITTKPAKLEILSSHNAKLWLTEGKYHQVKRMFGFFQNEVLALHRTSVGNIHLGDLKPGQSRQLSLKEIKL